MFSSVSNSASASVLASSVLPTPVGPRKMNEPIGRRGSLMPARARITASATARPPRPGRSTRSCRISSSFSSFSRSPSTSRVTGMPVQRATISAISSSVTSSRSSAPSPCFSAIFASGRLQLLLQLREPAVLELGGLVEVVGPLGLLASRGAAARSARAARARSADRLLLALPLRAQSRLRLAADLCQLLAQLLQALLARRVLLLRSAASSISSCITRRVTASSSAGIESISVRIIAHASSTRSIALSGRKRSVM